MSQCVLSDEERELFTQWLAEAEAAFHALMMGTQARVIVDQNGERVEFTAGNKSSLYAWILTLKSKLGLLTSPCSGLPSGPARFYF